MELLDDGTEEKWAMAYDKKGRVIRVRRTDEEGEKGYHHRTDPWHKLRTPQVSILLPKGTPCWTSREGFFIPSSSSSVGGASGSFSRMSSAGGGSFRSSSGLSARMR